MVRYCTVLNHSLVWKDLLYAVDELTGLIWRVTGTPNKSVLGFGLSSVKRFKDKAFAAGRVEK